ncbi:hypothetical protein ACFQZO_33005 [Bradyrhizobium sp. GCM10027634]|uniref:hypothetical protein n=1 Tax=unclassified Bradyrhizobium TaxID=2631580 RepID=UPI00188CF19D|nr:MULTISPECIES: hypothetical protein [unclassified Bradyrhizobium]MDN5005673.1 hypothetical protein [Bradyrhizobium sp. WYCCWR 12677]QOZ44551.1 hypothetical protein XH89_14450 [Bradyrhizobium sp. CCBAU 53340]
MSGSLRLCFASLALVEILSAAPASSNPLADIFNSAASQPAATSPPQAECVRRPGNSPPVGQHWVYRMDGHRKCWFLTEGIAKVKTTSPRRVVKNAIAGLDENRTASSRQSAVVDVRAKWLRSAPPERSQPRRPEVTLADAAPDPGATTALMSVTIIAEQSPRPTLSVSSHDQVDVEQLLAAAPANETLTSTEPPTMPIDVLMLTEEARNNAPSRTATWLGLFLVMLGTLSLLSSSRSLRHAVRLHF